MGYVIYRPGGDGVRTNIEVWPNVLRLARQHGWEPAGTELIGRPDLASDPELLAQARRDWDGGYCWNSYALVKAEDAKALGAALEKALAAATPDSDEAAAFAGIGGMVQTWKKDAVPPDFDETLFVGREFIAKLAELCREGPMIID